MAGIYSIGSSAGHRYAGWLETVEAKNFQFGGKVFNGSPSAIYVGSKMVWANWLTIATQQAILGAFGQRDGKAVINATNAYLNQLAASDRDKATALAALINEDPMMVCSLGLEVELTVLPKMPIRGLRTDKTAYINTGIKATSNTDIELGFFGYINGSGQEENILFGARNGSWSANYGCNNNSLSRNGIYAYYNYDGRTNIAAKEKGTYKLAKGKLYIDGEQAYTNTYSAFSFNLDIHLFGTNNGGTHQYTANIAGDHGKLWVNDELVRDFLPFRLGKAWSADKVSTGVAQAKDTLGMIDLVTGIFYPNAASSGAFTMEGEPTPSTP